MVGGGKGGGGKWTCARGVGVMAGFMKGWGGMDVGRADGEQQRKEGRKEGRRRKEGASPLRHSILALSSYSPFQNSVVSHPKCT